MADRWGDLAYALGGWSEREDRRTGRTADGPVEKWTPNLKVIKAVIQFVIKTGRFQPKAMVEEIKITGEVGGEEVEEESDRESVGSSP